MATATVARTISRTRMKVKPLSLVRGAVRIALAFLFDGFITKKSASRGDIFGTADAGPPEVVLAWLSTSETPMSRCGGVVGVGRITGRPGLGGMIDCINSSKPSLSGICPGVPADLRWVVGSSSCTVDPDGGAFIFPNPGFIGRLSSSAREGVWAGSPWLSVAPDVAEGASPEARLSDTVSAKKWEAGRGMP
jgi:hypothetical protein